MSRDHVRIDVTGLQPSARAIAVKIAGVYVKHLGPSLLTLVAHGSAVKGGLIPGSSDLDTVAIARPEALTAAGALPLAVAIALHRDLAAIDPAPYRYLQGYVHQPGRMPGIAFIPGTFHIVLGDLDVPIATGPELLAAAHRALAALDPEAARAGISQALLDHGEGRLDRRVRWTCTDVWPLLYHVACVHLDDGLAAWQRTKHDLLPLLAADPVVGVPLRRWFETVTDHYATGEGVETALATLAAATGFYDAAARWYALRG
jgi:hypothetical protein